MRGEFKRGKRGLILFPQKVGGKRVPRLGTLSPHLGGIISRKGFERWGKRNLGGDAKIFGVLREKKVVGHKKSAPHGGGQK